jgi:hypothetical protein
MQEAILQYFRCAELPAAFRLAGPLAPEAGFFGFGPGVFGYARNSAVPRATRRGRNAVDLFSEVRFQGRDIALPFDPDDAVGNLRYERYLPSSSVPKGRLRRVVRNAYYVARPALPVFVRKYLQKAHLNGWRKLSFPSWPVDVGVDRLLQKLLALAIQAGGGEGIPFIWFWPEGASACAVMTHDVETQAGVESTPLLLDLNDSCGIPAAYQIVPEERYEVTDAYLNTLRDRGQEINVQGLNHDGHLFRDKESFRQKAARINQYGREWGSAGFRSPVLYRNQEWFEFLDFEYDSSVPNVGHLDPQRGGCCTVMPYFTGGLVELPVTMTQDYTLFHILNDYSPDLWNRQIEIIVEQHGLINTIVHPDYLSGAREQEVYRGLLHTYVRLRDEQDVWIALPREVSAWWRQRSQMRLGKKDGQWRIEGPGSERARLAFAGVDEGRLTYSLAQPDGITARASIAGAQSPAI